MKVGVLKLGSRISFGAKDCSGANGEARSICKLLKQGGADVHIYTKILAKDNLVGDFNWHNIKDEFKNLNNLDAIVVINGTVQFYGGMEDYEQLLNYQIINEFQGPVFYIYCDPELTLKQVWPSVSKKPWAGNWTEKMLNIVRDDITYLSQPNDVNMILADLKKNEIIPANIIHFPFEKFPCLNEHLPLNPNPEVDLSYGGTMRGGKRQKKMAKFYFGLPPEISVEMFGKIELKDFDEKHIIGLRPPTFTGSVRYDEMLPKMNKAMCHVVIGDPYYEKINDIPQRFYESVWSNVITFIDSDMDKMRRVWANDKTLGDFLYVNDKQELSEKILLIKSDKTLRKQILLDQKKAIGFSDLEYCLSFTNLIKENI
jgi:hypothetical protein